MKKCFSKKTEYCGLLKNETDFYKDRNICKTCVKIKDQERRKNKEENGICFKCPNKSYNKNKYCKQCLLKYRKYNNIQKQKIKKIYDEWMKNKKCEHKTNRCVHTLELDHVNKNSKITELTRFKYWSHKPVELYIKELNKCRVLCVYHHRLHTHGKHIIYTDRTERNYNFLRLYINNVYKDKCVDCDRCVCTIESERLCDFDWDHISNEKNYEISKLIYHGYSLDTLKKELLLCEFVCVDCHKYRTLKRNHNKRQKILL